MQVPIVGPLLDSLQSKLSTSEKSIENEASLNVYPNPNTIGSKIYVDLASFAKNESVTITMYDSNGQPVQVKTVDTDATGSNSTEFSLSTTLNPGIYIIKAQAPSGSKQTKVIIK